MTTMMMMMMTLMMINVSDDDCEQCGISMYGAKEVTQYC